MGYIRHDAVIAIVDDEKIEKKLRSLRLKMKKANYQKCILGPATGINGYNTWVFAPDGSKEGWDSSNEGDKYRSKFMDIVNSGRYPCMVHLQFGGDDRKTIIHSTTDHDAKEEEEWT